jgi:hypothetical protein
MNLYVTEIQALNPHTKDLRIWSGPHVPGISFEDAQRYCDENLGYCKVVGKLVSEIPCKNGVLSEPDFDNRIEYDTINLN